MNLTSIIKRPILAELQAYQKVFEGSFHNDVKLLSEVLQYIHRGNGKSMRPILLMLSAKAFGGINEVVLHAAASLELLHTASLVHDDVVDESDKRRGQRSINSVFDNRVAVLSGDYLLSTCLLHASLTHRTDIIETVARLGQNLSEGELLQLSNIHNKELSEDVYFEVIRKKTAVLFGACCQIGVSAVNGSANQIAQLEQFGETLGLCFQIKDDIFDYFDNESIGKPTGNDMREGKLTLPALHVLLTYPDATQWMIGQKVKQGTATDEEIQQLVQFTVAHGGIEYAETTMLRLREKALSYLEEVHHPEVKEALTAYLDYVIQRKK